MLMGRPSVFVEDYGQQCGFLHTNYSVSLRFSMKWQFFIGLWLKIGHPCRLSFRSLRVRHLVCIATGCHRWQIAKIFEIFHATHCSLESPCWPTLISAAHHLYQQDTLTRWRSFQSFLIWCSLFHSQWNFYYRFTNEHRWNKFFINALQVISESKCWWYSVISMQSIRVLISLHHLIWCLRLYCLLTVLPHFVSE